MFPDKDKTYPGRKFVQALQVGLVIAIGVFGLMSLARPQHSPTPVQTASPTAAPDNRAVVLYERAWTAHDRDNHDQAIDLYTQALELDPTLANAWLGRGVAYEQTGANSRLSRNDFWRYLQRIETERIERDITINEPMEFEMVEGRVYVLSFEAQEGDTLDVTAKNIQENQRDETNGVDPLIVLLLEDTLLRADDDILRSDGTLISMNSHIDNYKVTRDGTYTVFLSHAGGGSYGLLDVTVSIR